MSIDRNNIKSAYDYVKAYSDMPEFNSYRNAYFINVSVPPLSFKVNGVPANTYKWEKKIGAIATFTDFPTDGPVKRDARHDIYTCAELGLEVDIELTEYPELPILEYLPVIKNIGDKNSPVISDVRVLDNVVMTGVEHVDVHHMNGGAFRSNEYAPFTDTLCFRGGQNTLSLSETTGFATNYHLPNFNLEDKEHGRGVIAVLSWAGCWKADFGIWAEKAVTISAGQNETNYVLLPGESARTPLTVLLFYRGNYCDGQNIWRYWYYKYNVLRYQGKRMTTNLLYCISSDDNGMLNNEQQNFDSIKLACDMGITGDIDFINQDAGWFNVKPETSWGFTGDWYPDEERYPNGLKSVSDMAHKNGMLYSVWFEPERSIKGRQVQRELGTYGTIWPIKREDGKHYAAKPDEVPDGANLLTNYAIPEVVDYIVDMLDKVIKEQGIDQYRQDENFQRITEYWEAYDNTMAEELGIPRTGLAEEKFVVGYHRMWETLIRRNNGLLIDACAGGGRRNDLETVRMSFIHTRSDYYWDTEDTQGQTYGMSMWYMLMGSAMLKMADEYDRRSRLITSVAFQPPCNEAELAIFRNAIDKWKNYMTMFFSSYYPLTPFTTDRDGILSMQYEDIDSGRGMIPIYIRRSGSITVFPKGLCRDCDYLLWSEDAPDDKRRVSGCELMEKGISVSSDKQYAFMYLYERQ